MSPHTPDIVAEHLDELPTDCARRIALLDDPRAFPDHLRALDDIIAARIEGIALAGTAAESALGSAAASGDATETCAAAMCLLASGSQSAWDLLLGALENGACAWPGIAKALIWSNAEPPVGALHALADSRVPSLAVVGLVGLAARGDVRDRSARVAALAADPDAEVRAHAFQSAAMSMLPPPSMDAILAERDPATKCIALDAAAWSAASWLLDHHALRNQAHALAVAAAVSPASSDDEQHARFLAACSDPTLGAARFGILATLGDPSVVPALLEALSDPVSANALAAGAAFSRMFAADIDSERMVRTSAETADDFEHAFADAAALPDPDLAHRLWRELAPALGSATRIASGMDVGRPFDLDALDLRSRREWAMRRAFHGLGGPGAADLERVGCHSPAWRAR